MQPKWKFLGVLTFLVPVLIMTYYAVIGGWITKYACVYLTGRRFRARGAGRLLYVVYHVAGVACGVRPAVYGGDSVHCV